MRYLRAALARISGFLAGQPANDDLRDELQSHLDMETAENVRRGMNPDDARRQALMASGGLTQAAEAVHDQRGLPWIDGLVADLKYAFRSLRRTPAFTAVVVLLFGIAPHDPATFIGVAVMMATVGIVACWIPALRAARIDPAISMR
jgi:hypothetical protein